MVRKETFWRLCCVASCNNLLFKNNLAILYIVLCIVMDILRSVFGVVLVVLLLVASEPGSAGAQRSTRHGGFHSHGGTPKWMVYRGKSQSKMDDSGVPLF